MEGSNFSIFKDLNEKALVEILTVPKNALIKQYKKMFDMENVKLTFTDDALESIANRALLRKTGARGSEINFGKHTS